MNILTQCDHVGDEMPRRALARIAGSANAAPIGRIADCPASAGAPATAGWDLLPSDLAAIDIGEADDRRTISREQAPRYHLYIYLFFLPKLLVTERQSPFKSRVLCIGTQYQSSVR
jgi:hypothetical protein